MAVSIEESFPQDSYSFVRLLQDQYKVYRALNDFKRHYRAGVLSCIRKDAPGGDLKAF